MSAVPLTDRVAAHAAERHFWSEWRLDPSHSAYHVVFVHELRGTLDPERLRRACLETARAHAALQATFDDAGDAVWRRDGTAPAPTWTTEHNPRSLDVASFVQRLHEAPFDLRRGPLLRFGLMRCSENRWIWVTCAHHIIFDGGSIPLLFEEISARYEGREARHALPFPRPERRCAMDPWQTVFCTPTVDVAGPTHSVPGPPVTRSTTFLLPEDLCQQSRDMARRTDATRFETWAAAWFALLHRYTQSNDLLLSYPVSTRPHDAAHAIGCWVTTRPMRARFDEETTFRHLIGQVRLQRLAGEAWADATLPEIVAQGRRSGLLSDTSTPIPFGFAQTHLREVRVSFGDVDARPLPPPPIRALWDLQLEYEARPTPRFRLNARADRTPPWLVEQLARHWQALLRTALAEPDTPIATLPYLSPDEYTQLTRTWADGSQIERIDTDLGAAFRRQAEATPDRIAVELTTESWTYRTLSERAHAWAKHLVQTVGPAPTVAIQATRAEHALLGMVATVLAGGTYVPLRADDPPPRITEILAASGADALFVDGDDAAETSVRRVRIDADPPPTASGPLPSRSLDSRTYVMFTSGSTGAPKGVQIADRGVLRLAEAMREVGVGDHDRLLHTSSLAFDASTFEIWVSLLLGATLVCLPPEAIRRTDDLHRTLLDRQITTLWLTSARFLHVARRRPETFRALRRVITGGETMDPRGLAAACEACAGAVDIVNAYGPTENTTFTTLALYRTFDPEHEEVTIGRPIAGTTTYVLDAHGQPVPPGVDGELCTGGHGVALGYLDDDERTSERFVTNPYGSGEAPLLYRTGDRARWTRHGQLVFRGRADRQVKIRGYRVEPQEVDGTAMRLAGVAEAATVVDGHDRPELVLAYCGAATEPEVRAHLAARLPSYLVPARIRRLRALPLTTNGKLDHAAVLAAVPRAAPPVADPPRTPAEALLAELWSEILDQRVDRQTNFFEAGGDSLRVVELLERLDDATGVALTLADVEASPRLSDLATRLDAGTTLPRLPKTVGPEPKSMPLSRYQEGHWLTIRRGQTFQSVMWARLTRCPDNATIRAAWQAVLERHEAPWQSLDLRRPRRRALPHRAARVAIRDLSGAPRAAVESAVRTWAAAEATRPYVPNRLPIRALVLRTTPNDVCFGVAMPHALIDGHGLRQLLHELTDVLSGTPPTALPPPPSLRDHLVWERDVVTPESVEAACAWYENHLNRDATYLLPRHQLTPRTHGAETRLDDEVLAGLVRTARALGTTVEHVATWCGFLACHAYFGVDTMRCFVPVHNRDLPALRRLPTMMANAVYLQSTLSRDDTLRDTAKAFLRTLSDAMTHRRLPPLVLYAFSRMLLVHGSIQHHRVSRWVASVLRRVGVRRAWGELAYTVDLFVAQLAYRYARWRDRNAESVVSTGCMVNVSTSLGASPPRHGVGLDILRRPVHVPEMVPGNPSLDVYRKADGVYAFFQARYRPDEIRRFLDTFSAIARYVATDLDTGVSDVLQRSRS